MATGINSSGKDIYKFALIRLNGEEEAKAMLSERFSEEDDENNAPREIPPDKIAALKVLQNIVGEKMAGMTKDDPSSALVLMAVSAFTRTVALPYAASEIIGLLEALKGLDNDVRALEKYSIVRDDDMPNMTEELGLTKGLRDAIKGMLDAAAQIKAYVERNSKDSGNDSSENN